MKVYHFDRLLGTVYRKGNVLFFPDGDSLISPVGNRISKFDLRKNDLKTLSVEGSHNYTTIDVSPNGKVLVAGNEIGEVHVISLVSLTLLHCLKMAKGPSILKFSPDGQHFAVAVDNTVFIFRAPALTKTFNPFTMERVFKDSKSDVTCIDWSFDSKLLLVGGQDMMLRVYPFEKYKNFTVAVFTNHTDVIVNAFFENDSYNLYSISRNRQLCQWSCSATPDKFILASDEKKINTGEVDSDDEFVEKVALPVTTEGGGIAISPPQNRNRNWVRFKKVERYYLYGSETLGKGEKPFKLMLTCADYNKKTNVLVTGYSDGIFIIHSLPNPTQIQSHSISEHNISTVRFNQTGDWIAFGCPTLGQLLVWEWASETYVLKQQGHLDTMLVCAYSPDGRHIVSGGHDGKVKVWETRTSFCFITFTEHTTSVTGVVFTQNGNAILSSSLDGTVRAFDLVRYRNFRTFTSPRPAQFSCVTVDSSREFVAAGANDLFDIFLWSMKTGRLLEVLSGHEGPVTSVMFAPTTGSTQLASVSWDKTLRIWDTVEDTGNREIYQLNSEGTCLAYRPDGDEVAVGTLDCHILLFKPKTGEQRGTIEGRNHLGSGISVTDKITAEKNLAAKAFTSLSYSPDGIYLLAAGESKNICYYDIVRQVLLKKYEITQNKSLDGMNDFIHHKNLTEFGSVAHVNNQDDLNDAMSLPGVRLGDMSSRSVRPEVRVTSLCFSPTGCQWIATSTEGLFLYNYDNWHIFMPISADEHVTPQAIHTALGQKAYDEALLLSLHLNLEVQTRQVLESVPITHIEAVCAAISPAYRELFIRFLANEIGISKHFQFCLLWADTFLRVHLMELKTLQPQLLSSLNMLEKNMVDKQKDLMSLSDHNKYTIKYLLKTGPLTQVPSTTTTEEEDIKPSLNPEDDMYMDTDDTSSDDEDLFLMSQKA